MNDIRNMFILLALRRKLDEMNIKMEDLEDIEIDEFSNQVKITLKGAIRQSVIELEIK